jgi:hypothetical protein
VCRATVRTPAPRAPGRTGFHLFTTACDSPITTRVGFPPPAHAYPPRRRSPACRSARGLRSARRSMWRRVSKIRPASAVAQSRARSPRRRRCRVVHPRCQTDAAHRRVICARCTGPSWRNLEAVGLPLHHCCTMTRRRQTRHKRRLSACAKLTPSPTPLTQPASFNPQRTRSWQRHTPAA